MNRKRVPQRYRLRLAAFALLAIACFSGPPAQAQDPTSVLNSEHAPNAAATLQKHYVVLVSLDGFRYDFAKKYDAKNLQALATAGATAPDGMIPAYPSITFPNHLTLVTGLYPEHHGIVANNFYDPVRKQTFRLSDPAVVTDGAWYGGTPIWVLAEQQGMRSACFFWPGSEAEIQGTRPSYYLKYDGKIPNDKRVAQVLAWLRLPEAQRPHLITLYFGDADKAAQRHAGQGQGEPLAQAVEVDVVAMIARHHGETRQAAFGRLARQHDRQAGATGKVQLIEHAHHRRPTANSGSNSHCSSERWSNTTSADSSIPGCIGMLWP